MLNELGLKIAAIVDLEKSCIEHAYYLLLRLIVEAVERVKVIDLFGKVHLKNRALVLKVDLTAGCEKRNDHHNTKGKCEQTLFHFRFILLGL